MFNKAVLYSKEQLTVERIAALILNNKNSESLIFFFFRCFVFF